MKPTRQKRIWINIIHRIFPCIILTQKKNTTLKFLSPRNIMCFFRPFLHLTGRTLPWKIIIEYIGVSVGTWKIKLFIKEVVLCKQVYVVCWCPSFCTKLGTCSDSFFFLFACPGFLLGSYLNRVNLDYNNYVQSHISIELDPNLLIHILSTMVFHNCFAFILC